MADKELFGFTGNYNVPFDGILGNSPEAKIIYCWIGLDSPDGDRTWFSVNNIFRCIDEVISRERITKILNTFILYDVVSKKNEYDIDFYSMNFESDYWKGINIFNKGLIKSTVNILKKQDAYMKKRMKRDKKGIYQCICPICTGDMIDRSWKILPFGHAIHVECPKCNFKYSYHIRKDTKMPPSKSVMPLKERNDMLVRCPSFVEEYDIFFEKFSKEGGQQK